MARLPYSNPEDPERREAAAQVVASRKKLGHLHRMLLHSPPIAVGWIRFWDAVRRETRLSGKLRELVICQVAAINGAQYEWVAHAPIGLAEGLTQAQLDALPDWQASTGFDATERAALALCDAMTRHVHVPAEVFTAVKAALPEREVVELTVTIASYNCVSRVLEALEINGADPLQA
jgi:alkylhydroperoxidase family enzyme